MTWICAALSLLALDLEPYRWKSRVLILFPPASVQAATLKQSLADLKERDVVVIEIPSQQGASLRKQFKLGPGFALILIGKDGSEKARWLSPVDPAKIFERIDSMPMRQSEMKSKP